MQNYNLNQFSQKLNEFSAEIYKYEEFLNNFPKCKNLNVLQEIVLLSKKSALPQLGIAILKFIC